MKKTIIFFLLCIMTLTVSAQHINHTFKDVSLSDALKYIDKQTKDYSINFIFDELEDFKVSTTVQNLSVMDAVRQVVGFYPMNITLDGKEVYVECVKKDKIKITGHVVDKEHQPVIFTNVMVLSARDSSFITGGVCNESGDFVIPCNVSSAIVKFSCVGYRTLFKRISSPHVGTVMLLPDSKMLAEVKIKQTLPKYRMTDKGYNVNVQGTALASLGDANDVLAQLPRIKGSDGEFTIFGKGAPIYYINGRLMRNNNELRQLRSTDIKTIEVLTTPGAQYASDVNAVIKIKTIRRQGEGLSGSVTSYYRQAFKATTFDYINLNYRYKKLDVFTNLNFYNYFDRLHQTTQEKIIGNKNIINSQAVWRLQQRFMNLGDNVGFNYTLNDDNSFGVRYEINKQFSPIYYREKENEQVQINGKDAGYLDYDFNDYTSNGPNHELDGYYSGKIGKVGIDMNTSYIWRKTNGTSATYETSDYLESRKVSSVSQRHNRMIAGKVVVSYPVSDKISVNVGSEYTHSDNHQQYNNAEGYVQSSDNNRKESNIAGFSEANMKFGKYSFGAGLRYEHVKSDYYDNGVFSAEESKIYNDWFPTLSASYNSGNWQIQFSKTTQALRPSYGSLSSSITYVDRYTLQGGNPLLKTCIRHEYELDVAHKWLNFSATYDYVVRPQTNYSKLYDNTSDIVLSTYENVKNYGVFLMSLSASPTIGIWHPKYEIDFWKQTFDASPYGVNENLKKPSWELSAMNMFVLKHGWTFGIDYTYCTDSYTQFVIFRHKNLLSCYAIKTFCNNKLTAKIAVEDILHDNYDSFNIYNGCRTLYQDRYQDRRYVQLSISYNFNATGSKYRGSGAGNAEKGRL